MKYFMVLLLVSTGMLACQKKEKLYTLQEMKYQSDSAVGAQMKDLKALAEDDLDKRSAIELKPKADSIVQALEK